LFLGYKINSRTMMVTWPYYKRTALLKEIEEALAAHQKCITPKLAAQPLLLARFALSMMWLLGDHIFCLASPRLSRLQHNLLLAIENHGGKGQS
jgi:hypothetical protein